MVALKELEKDRKRLESQVAEVENALKYWQNWELDYEILKEEIVSSRAKTPELLSSVTDQYEGRLLKQPELQKLLKPSGGDARTAKEVINLISHRLEYVRGNVDSLSKRRNNLSEQLYDDAPNLLSHEEQDESYPLTEITEELDEQGNVIARSTSTPDDNLLKKLSQNNLSKAPVVGKTTAEPITSEKDFPSSNQLLRKATAEAAAKARADALVTDLDAESVEHLVDEDEDREDNLSAEQATVSLLESIANVTDSKESALGPTLTKKPDAELKSANILDDRDLNRSIRTYLSESDSQEQAALRREMLEYSLNEVGAVVAEMDLEMGSGDEDAYEGIEEYDSEDESGEEDEYGRTINPKIPEDYKREMEELERQLGVQRIRNVGPAPGRISPVSENEDMEIEKHTVSSNASNAAAPTRGAMKKKEKRGAKPRGVRFAEDVEFSETLPKPTASDKSAKSRVDTGNIVRPMADEVLERSPSAVELPPETKSTQKVSRFRDSLLPNQAHSHMSKDMNAPAVSASAEVFAGTLLDATNSRPQNQYETPEGPQGVTHGDVIEHESTSTPSDPADGDDDPAIQRRRLASDYYEKRNAQIQSQGGFRAPEPAAIRIDENGDEIKAKVSRFKAARLRKDG